MINIPSGVLELHARHPNLLVGTRIANFLLVVGFAYWLGKAPQLVNAITLAALVIGFVLMDVVLHASVVNAERRRARDGELFADLLHLLPPDRGIKRVRELQHWHSIPSDALNDLYTFADTWVDDPTRRFRIPELERLRQRLHGAVTKYTLTLAENVFTPEGLVHIKRVPREWEHEQPERHRRVMRQLDEQAEEAIEAYDSLVDVARRRYAF